METNVSLSELVILNLYLGIIVYILGIVYQLLIIYRNKSISRTILKVSSILLTTLISSMVFSILIWKFWIFDVDMMFGPILLPSLISEIILAPLTLKLFGYKLFIKNN